MNEKTVYEQPQIEVVDAYPEKAYCSTGSGDNGDTENLTVDESGKW